MLHALTSALIAATLAAAPYDPQTAAKGTFIYDLSDTDGPVPSSWASLAWDSKHRELFVVDREDGSVGIFNEGGMEIFRFGQDAELGTILAVAPLEQGDLIVLANEQGRPVLHRCNFRGVSKARIRIGDLPPEFAKDFAPEVMVARGEKLYLAQRGSMKVLVVDVDGNVEATHDFFRELGLDKTKTARGGVPAMQAFNVDDEGDYLFTVAPMFKVFVVTPSGKATSFGDRGGSPGKFNVVGGVTRDARGRFLVGDVLRGVVMVFSPELEFRGEFGGRGWGPGELIAPMEVAVAGDQVFVSQSARRGVSAFRLVVQEPPPPPPPAPPAPNAPATPSPSAAASPATAASAGR